MTTFNRSYFSIKNKTQFVGLQSTPKEIRIKNPELFTIKEGKQFEYFVRAYYHYRDVTELRGGRCYFYTLTLNPNNLHHANCYFNEVPEFEGLDLGKSFRCFDYYNEVRWLLNDSGFRHALKKENTGLDYMITAELGSKNGRPHYHCLFYTYPLNRTLSSCSDYQFEHLLLKYWHGFTSSVPPFVLCKHKDAIRGIVQAGKLGAVVKSHHALAYVAKYCGKDINIETLCKKAQSLCFRVLFKQYIFSKEEEWLNSLNITDPLDQERFYNDEPSFKAYCRNRALERTKEIMCGFRSRCTNRVRISQGFGLCLVNGSKFSVNPKDPFVEIPNGNSITRVNLPLYCFRKLFYCYHDEYGKRLAHIDGDAIVYKEFNGFPIPHYKGKPCFDLENPYSGNIEDHNPLNIDRSLRPFLKYYKITTDDYIQYRLSTFYKQLNKDCISVLEAILNLKDKFVLSHFLKRFPHIKPSHVEYLVEINSNLPQPQLWADIVPLYCIYNSIYRYRVFDYFNPQHLDDEKQIVLSCVDVHSFCPCTFKLKGYVEEGWSQLEGVYTDLVDYINHPRFEPLVKYLDLLDSVCDFALMNKALAKEDKFNERRKVKEFYNQIMYH